MINVFNINSSQSTIPVTSAIITYKSADVVVPKKDDPVAPQTYGINDSPIAPR